MTSLPLLERPSDGAVIRGISRLWRRLRRQSESPGSGSGIGLAHHRIRRLLRLDSDSPSLFFGLPRCRRRLDLGVTPSTKRILVDCAGLVCSPFLDALVVLRSVECCASCQVHWSPTTKENPRTLAPTLTGFTHLQQREQHSVCETRGIRPIVGRNNYALELLELCTQGVRTLKLTTVRSGGKSRSKSPSLPFPPKIVRCFKLREPGWWEIPHTFPAQLAVLPALINLVTRLVVMSL